LIFFLRTISCYISNYIFIFFRKPITITAERLSDNSRITFTISSDKTIEQLRSLLNHHLPPLSSGKFDLYSYQRGALIHFHPSSFKLDYFPVIFDQSVLLLKMDDRLINNTDTNSPKKSRNKLRKDSKKDKCLLFNELLSSKTSTATATAMPSTRSNSPVQQTSPTNVTCLSLLKQIFHQSSSNNVNTNSETNILTY
jgi:hypothetical protein